MPVSLSYEVLPKWKEYERASTTLADAYLYVVASWLPGDGVDIADFPRLSRFMSAMRARPSSAAI